MIIAIDFDGTLVDHEYPRIGKEKLFAFETLKLLLKADHRLILWTIRSGKELDEAVEFCSKKGVEFYAVNRNYPEEVFVEGAFSRKINADLFIDDRNLGGFLGWSAIYQTLCQTGVLRDEINEHNYEHNERRKGFFARIFGF
jgi:hydroxymethylpyrimidine pyrophosphatase-like HAD family hydrolase